MRIDLRSSPMIADESDSAPERSTKNPPEVSGFDRCKRQRDDRR